MNTDKPRSHEVDEQLVRTEILEPKRNGGIRTILVTLVHRGVKYSASGAAQAWESDLTIEMRLKTQVLHAAKMAPCCPLPDRGVIGVGDRDGYVVLLPPKRATP